MNVFYVVFFFVQENRGTVAAAPNMQINSAIDWYVSPLPGNNLNMCQCVSSPPSLPRCFVSQDMLDAIEAIQGTFRQIQSLSRRQKDQLKRFRGGNETSSGNF